MHQTFGHHATNAAAVAAPAVAWAFSGGDVLFALSVLTGVLSAVYYSITIYKALKK